MEYLELAYLLATLHDDRTNAARALNGIATVHQISGKIELAEETYIKARALAGSDGDDLTAGDIEQNLGTLSNIRGELCKAMTHYKLSLSLYERIQHDKGIAHVLNNMGMLYADMDEMDAAAESLDAALSICKRLGDSVSAAPVYLNRAEVYISRRDYVRARSCCDHAFEIASQCYDNRTKAEALKYYGVIFRETGMPHLANAHLEQAISIASKYSLPLTEAESLRELALLLRLQNRNKEALEALNRSHALFSRLQAKQDEADVTRRLEKLQDDFLSVVRFWSESIEEKDGYTRGHCQRVADYACLIGERAGILEQEMIWFRMGAFLHDVGKMAVPEAILLKRGALSKTERKIIERHVIKGDELLAAIPFPWDIRPMIRSHHERWDGDGYPDALSGEEIPLTARILRLADVFDALTTTRSYRRPLTAEEARQVMRDDCGAFDPALFAVFESLFPQLVSLAGLERAASPESRVIPHSVSR